MSIGQFAQKCDIISSWLVFLSETLHFLKLDNLLETHLQGTIENKVKGWR